MCTSAVKENVKEEEYEISKYFIPLDFGRMQIILLCSNFHNMFTALSVQLCRTITLVASNLSAFSFTVFPGKHNQLQ